MPASQSSKAALLNLCELERRDTPAFVAAGPEILATNSISTQRVMPAIASDPAGDTVVTWASGSQDGWWGAVYAQRYNAAGEQVGVEFQVNTRVIHNQNNPTVAMDADGDFVIAWQSYYQDASGYGIYAQRFSADGTRQGEEFRVNTTEAGNQNEPSIAMAPDGDFVVSWQSKGQDGSDHGIYAQRYNSSGIAQGTEFRVNTTTRSDQINPAVAMNSAGDFVIAWSSLDQADIGLRSYARKFNSLGVPQTGEIQITPGTIYTQRLPNLAMDSAGNFTVAWQSYEPTPTGFFYGVYAKRFNAAGAAQGSEFRVGASTPEYDPSVAMNAAGDFAISWWTESDNHTSSVSAQRYSANGNAIGTEFRLDQLPESAPKNAVVAIDANGDISAAWVNNLLRTNDVVFRRFAVDGSTSPTEVPVAQDRPAVKRAPATDTDAHGNYVVVWISVGHEHGGFGGVYARQYSADGTALGPEILVSTATPNKCNTSVAVAPDGSFVVTWDSLDEDGSGAGIYARQYDAHGVARGVAFRVNVTTLDSQENPSVAIDNFGNFVIAWQSNNQDGSGKGIYARQYDANGMAIGGENRVNTTTINNQQDPAVACDAVGNFVVVWRSDGQDGSGAGIFGQRFDSAGNRIGNEFRVNIVVTNDQLNPEVAMDPAGNFTVTWQSFNQDWNNRYAIFARRFDSLGTPGLEIPVSLPSVMQQVNPSVGMDALGHAVVSWQNFTADYSDGQLLARQLNADGSSASAPEVVTFQGYYPASKVAVDPNGDFVVAWQAYGQDDKGIGIRARRFESTWAPTMTGVPEVLAVFKGKTAIIQAVGHDSPGDTLTFSLINGPRGATIDPTTGLFQWTPRLDTYSSDYTFHIRVTDNGPTPLSEWKTVKLRYYGTPTFVSTGSEILATNSISTQRQMAAVASSPAGDTVVAWASGSQDGSREAIYAQRYNAVGDQVGVEFQVNSRVIHNQNNPTVAMDANGDFVIAWQSNDQDASGYGIYAQRFSADGTRQGDEFRVNTTEVGNQDEPSIAMAPNGDFIVSWQSNNQDGNRLGVYAQRYNSSGIAQGTEFRVTTTTTGDQANPSIAVNSTGDFVVAWESFGQDGDGWGSYARKFNSLGVPLSGEFRINTTTTGDQRFPNLAMDRAGDFTVAWQSKNQDGIGYGVYAQRFNASGAAQGSEFRVGASTTEFAPSVAMNAAGDFAISWWSQSNNANSSVSAQRYSADGTAQGAEFRLDQLPESAPKNAVVAMDANGDISAAWVNNLLRTNDVVFRRFAVDGSTSPTEVPVAQDRAAVKRAPATDTDAHGNYVVVWISVGHEHGGFGGVYARQYSADGTASGQEILVSTATPNKNNTSVAVAPDGSFVVTWDSLDEDGSGAGIYARQYDAHGVARGDAFRVNVTTLDTQENPSVACDDAGKFVIAWQSNNQDGSGKGIYARRYDSNGTSLGGEFRVNTTTINNQQDPAVACDAVGNFVVVWRSDGQDGSGAGIFGQRFDSAGNRVLIEFSINTFTSNDQMNPEVAMDPAGNFVVAWQSFNEERDSMFGIYARRFNAFGSLSWEIPVSIASGTQQVNPSVGMDALGHTVISWQNITPDYTEGQVLARQFNADSSAASTAGVITFQGSYPASKVAVDPHGDFVVVWQAYGLDDKGVGIRAKRYHALWAPTLTGVPQQLHVFPGQTSSIQAVGQDTQGDTLTYSLLNAPPGATIDPTTGFFQWTPRWDTIPDVYYLQIRVTDNGLTPLFDYKNVGIVFFNTPYNGVVQRDNNLLVGGTQGPDIIEVKPFGTDLVDVIINKSEYILNRSVITGVIWVQGMGGNDRITVDSGLDLSVSLNGGAGNDTLTGGSLNDQLEGGTGNDVLDGGGGDDVCRYTDDWGRDRITDKSGNDQLDFSIAQNAISFAKSVKVTTTRPVLRGPILTTRTDFVAAASGNNTVTATGIESVIGGDGADKLSVPVGNNLFTLTGDDIGSVGFLAFAGVESLSGGVGDDSLKILPGSSLSGSFNGGLGKNSLDYSAFSTGVSVNMGLGAATGINGGISNVVNATGGSGDDLLVGNHLANVLNGREGRDILIGGRGADTVDGGNGDDLLIAGFTSFDSDALKLATIRSEWSGPDSYSQRIAHLTGASGGLNGTIYLGGPALPGGATVFNDSNYKDSLVGGGGTDWFITSLGDKLNDLLGGEILTTV